MRLTSLSPQLHLGHGGALAVHLLLGAALTGIAAFVLLSVGYCVALMAAAAGARRGQKTAEAGAHREGQTRFCLIIPAHNEALVIAATLASVRALAYPPDRVRCAVVADNCTDATAAIARASLPGVRVMERFDARRRGKGYALNWALEQLLPQRDFDAVVIVDADTLIDPQFLIAMDRALARCDADGFAGQGLYQVQNAADSWRTSLMAGALSLVHYVRPLAREAKRRSVGLKGNGMCFGAGVLEQVAWRGESITEDIDFTLDLIEQRAVRVRFVPDAVVKAQMPTDDRVAAGQRKRWEEGRAEIARRRALRLLAAGIVRRDPLRVDAALDLICPPLAQLTAALAGWGALVAIAALLGQPDAAAWAGAWALAALGLAVYVLAGFKIGNAPAGAYRALLMAVVYVPWKLGAVASSAARGQWNRTARIEIKAVSPGAPNGAGADTALPESAPVLEAVKEA